MTIYNLFLEQISQFSGAEIDLIENLLGTLLVFAGYVLFRPFFRTLATKSVSEEYREEVISNVLPSVLKLVIFGFLAKIWLTGGASLESTLQISKPLMGHIVETIYVALLYLALKLSGNIFSDIKFAKDESKQYTLRRTLSVFTSLICFFLLVKIWLKTSPNFSTYLGLLSAGLAIALQDVITSLAGWIYILTVKPLKIGDRIQIAESTGDVIDIKLFQFCILETGNWIRGEQSTGRILYFPNSFIFKNSVANYDAGFDYIFAEMPITVTFESDWKKAKEILEKILQEEVDGSKENAARQIRKASKEMRLRFSHLGPRIITKVEESGVTLILRFLCKVRERRFIESSIWESVLVSFSKDKTVDFAYPTTRFYQENTSEKEIKL